MRRGQLWALLAVAVGAGCSGPGHVTIRADGSPGDEECPPGVKEVFEAFGLAPGDDNDLTLDVTRPADESPLIVYDGPIESRMWGSMGSRHELPTLTHIFGQVWTGGPRVVVRYYAALLEDGRKVPFCAVAAENGPGLVKSPGRLGSAAIHSQTNQVVLTSRFH